MFKKHIADYVLGNVSLSSMPEAAVHALVEGYDSPSLKMLAGESSTNSNPFEIKELFQHALTELGLSTPSVNEAAHTLVCYWVKRIVDGSVSPHEGASHVLNDAYRRTNYPKEKVIGEALGISSLLAITYQYSDLQDGFIELEGKSISMSDALIWLDEKMIEESKKYLQENCA
jgi:hypothetical protein